MGGSQQPYMYDAPSKSPAPFDPRAFSRKSWASASPTKHKTDGPLLEPEPQLDYNRHPDSHVQQRYGLLDAKSMSPKTKGAVKWTRLVQLALRVIQLVGAIELLICIIFIRGTQITEGWIIRIPPGIDTVAAIYAIYHLCRAAKSRTPASSASYHLFACLIDAVAIPFYVITAMLAKTNLWKEVGASGRWRSLFDSMLADTNLRREVRSFFDSDNKTDIIFKVTWLAAAVMSGLHLVSLVIDMWLVVVFRRIAALPPDMNPLEDNLTSRKRKSKHRYKDSDATVVISQPYNFKHLSGMSAVSGTSDSTLVASHPSPDRASTTGPEPKLPEVEARTISFLDTRNDPSTMLSPHSPRTTRMSQAALDRMSGLIPDPVASVNARNQSDLSTPHEPTLAVRRVLLTDGPANASIKSLTPPRMAAGRPNSDRNSTTTFVSAMSVSQGQDVSAQVRNSPVSPINVDAMENVWILANDSNPSSPTKSRRSHRQSRYDFESIPASSDEEDGHIRSKSGTVHRSKTYQPVPQDNHVDIARPLQPMWPLGMNPPSLPDLRNETENVPTKDSDTHSVDSGSHYSNSTTAAEPQHHHAVPTYPESGNHQKSNSFDPNLRSSATPRGKYYGDLASATRGIIRDHHTPAPPAVVPRHKPKHSAATPAKRPETWWFGDSADLASATRSTIARDHSAAAAPPVVPRHNATVATPAKRPSSWFAAGLGAAAPRELAAGGRPDASNPNLYNSRDRSPYIRRGGPGAGGGASARPRRESPRVVSSSGAEYDCGVGGGGGGWRRDVSGKIAEEGRGGDFDGVMGAGGFGGVRGWKGWRASAGRE